MPLKKIETAASIARSAGVHRGTISRRAKKMGKSNSRIGHYYALSPGDAQNLTKGLKGKR